MKINNYLASLGASLFPSLLGFVFFPIYAKWLGPEGYGALALLECCQVIGSILLLLGMTTSFYTFYSHAKTAAEKQVVFSTALSFGAILALALIVLLPFLPLAAQCFFDSPQGVYFLAAYAFAIFSDYLLSLLNGLLRAERKMSSVAANTICLSTLQHTLFLQALWFGPATLDSFVVAFFYTKVASLIFCSWRMRHLSLSFSAIDLALLKRMLQFGAPLILTSLTGWMLLLSDRIFIDAYGSLSDVGVYAVAYKFSACLTLALVQPFMAVWEPELFKIYAESEERAYDKLQRDFKIYLAVLVVLFSVQLLFIEDVITILFAKTPYRLGASLFPFLMGAQLLMGLGEMWGSVCRLHKTSRFAFAVTATAMMTKIGLNLILIPRYLLVGAALSSFLAEIVGQAIMAWYAFGLSAPRRLFFSKENCALVAGFFAVQLFLLTGERSLPLKIGMALVILLLCKNSLAPLVYIWRGKEAEAQNTLKFET